MKTLSLTSSLIAALSLSAAGATSNSYTVKPGDTLSKIARNNNTTNSQLIKWNKITDPSLISIGQKLIIREGAKAKSTAPAKSTVSKKTQSSVHTVSRGDTFYSIARKNKLSIGKLTELNPGVEPSRIIIGQKLKVSGSPAPAIRQAAAPRKKSTSAQATSRPIAKKSSSTPKKSSKKIPTTASTRSTASKKPSSTPTSSRKKSEPKPVAKKEAIPAPATASSLPKVEESKPAAPKSVSSVILTSETTFSDFASKHRTSTSQLNALNGWNLPKATVLARGSEIYVPK